MHILSMNPILIAAAVIPAVLLLVKVYKADRLEKEPITLLISLVFWGILSTLIAIALEMIGTMVLDFLFVPDSRIYNILMYFVVVGLSEEWAKYVLMKYRTWKNPNFNCQFDGVVYAVFVSLGFALWENLSYVGRYGVSIAIVRALTAVPGHACFGVFMGVFYGAAKRWENVGCKDKAKFCLSLSLLVPALIHGLYDFIATIGTNYSALLFIAMVALMFFIALRLVRLSAAADSYIDASRADIFFRRY